MSESTQAQLDALNLSVRQIQAQVTQLKAELAMRDAQADQAAAESLQAINKICESVSNSFAECVDVKGSPVGGRVAEQSCASVCPGESCKAQPRLDVLKSAMLPRGAATVCSDATDSEGRPLMEMNLKTGEFRLGGVRLSPPQTSELSIDPGQSVPPMRMGKVTFYGETARQIREAQEVLRAAGAGQLEVVKRANERDEPYVVIDGQMFINKAAVDEVAIEPLQMKISAANTDDALRDMDGLISKSKLCDQLLKNIKAISAVDQGGSLADQVRQVIREELQPGRLLGRHRQ